jgi:hypothetical protein
MHKIVVHISRIYEKTEKAHEAVPHSLLKHHDDMAGAE